MKVGRQRWIHVWLRNSSGEPRKKKASRRDYTKIQKCGRVASQGKKRHSKWDMQTQNRERTKRREKKNVEASVRENETAQILIKIKSVSGSFRKSARLLKVAHTPLRPTSC